MLPVAILAGGLATRLRPITKTIPKALVPVAGRPFVLWQLEYLRDQGVSRVVLCTGYRSTQIEQIVGDGSQCGVMVEYSDDGTTLLGTGGALGKALPLLGPEFFVLYGDSFLPVSFSIVEQAYYDSDLPGLMTVYRNEGEWDTSNVVFNDGQVLEYNKAKPRQAMAYIDYGLGVLSKSVVEHYCQEKVFDLANVYKALANARQLAGFEVFERFYEIGSPDGLAQTEEYLRSKASL
jgi:NDP-sugar pyrophosphorylase family protein